MYQHLIDLLTKPSTGLGEVKEVAIRLFSDEVRRQAILKTSVSEKDKHLTYHNLTNSQPHSIIETYLNFLNSNKDYDLSTSFKFGPFAGFTLLTLCTVHRRLDLIKQLLSLGVVKDSVVTIDHQDFNVVNNISDEVEEYEQLTSQCKAFNFSYLPALLIAIAMRDLELVRHLVKTLDFNIHNEVLIQVFVKHGELLIPTLVPITPLAFAVQIIGDLEIADYLLQEGADVSHVGKYTELTAMELAAKINDFEAMKFYDAASLKLGRTLEYDPVEDQEKPALLHYAASWSNLPMASFILEHLKNKDNVNFEYYAETKTDVLDSESEHFSYYAKPKAPSYESAFDIVVNKGCLSLVKLLLPYAKEKWSELDVFDKAAAFCNAISNGADVKTIVYYVEELGCTPHVIIDKNDMDDFSYVGQDDLTYIKPLHVAAAVGNLEVIKYFLELGEDAEGNLFDCDIKISPLELANKYKREGVKDLLEKFQAKNIYNLIEIEKYEEVQALIFNLSIINPYYLVKLPAIGIVKNKKEIYVPLAFKLHLHNQTSILNIIEARNLNLMGEKEYEAKKKKWQENATSHFKKYLDRCDAYFLQMLRIEHIPALNVLIILGKSLKEDLDIENLPALCIAAKYGCAKVFEYLLSQLGHLCADANQQYHVLHCILCCNEKDKRTAMLKQLLVHFNSLTDPAFKKEHILAALGKVIPGYKESDSFGYSVGYFYFRYGNSDPSVNIEITETLIDQLMKYKDGLRALLNYLRIHPAIDVDLAQGNGYRTFSGSTLAQCFIELGGKDYVDMKRPPKTNTNEPKSTHKMKVILLPHESIEAAVEKINKKFPDFCKVIFSEKETTFSISGNPDLVRDAVTRLKKYIPHAKGPQDTAKGNAKFEVKCKETVLNEALKAIELDKNLKKPPALDTDSENTFPELSPDEINSLKIRLKSLFCYEKSVIVNWQEKDKRFEITYNRQTNEWSAVGYGERLDKYEILQLTAEKIDKQVAIMVKDLKECKDFIINHDAKSGMIAITIRQKETKFDFHKFGSNNFMRYKVVPQVTPAPTIAPCLFPASPQAMVERTVTVVKNNKDVISLFKHLTMKLSGAACDFIIHAWENVGSKRKQTYTFYFNPKSIKHLGKIECVEYFNALRNTLIAQNITVIEIIIEPAKIQIILKPGSVNVLQQLETDEIFLKKFKAQLKPQSAPNPNYLVEVKNLAHIGHGKNTSDHTYQIVTIKLIDLNGKSYLETIMTFNFLDYCYSKEDNLKRGLAFSNNPWNLTEKNYLQRKTHQLDMLFYQMRSNPNLSVILCQEVDIFDPNFNLNDSSDQERLEHLRKDFFKKLHALEWSIQFAKTATDKSYATLTKNSVLQFCGNNNFYVYGAIFEAEFHHLPSLQKIKIANIHFSYNQNYDNVLPEYFSARMNKALTIIGGDINGLALCHQYGFNINYNKITSLAAQEDNGNTKIVGLDIRTNLPRCYDCFAVIPGNKYTFEIKDEPCPVFVYDESVGEFVMDIYNPMVNVLDATQPTPKP